jgi:hypothetical protein
MFLIENYSYFCSWQYEFSHDSNTIIFKAKLTRAM